MGSTIVTISVVVLLYMILFFFAALVKKNNSIVDIAWGGGFILVALCSLLLSPEIGARHWLITGLVIVWGTRLSVHILLRSKGKAEDFRYADMRRRWGKRVWIHSFIKIYLLQGVLLLILSFPIILNHHSAVEALRIFDLIGFVVWVIGFLFEVIGDYQLYRFKQNPNHRNKLMQSGLWKYSRHPNYFGEALLWWGIAIMLISVPYGWISLFSPLLLTFLLLKVSGVPLLEEKYKNHPDFAQYAQRTNQFVPWFPRKFKMNREELDDEV